MGISTHIAHRWAMLSSRICPMHSSYCPMCPAGNDNQRMMGLNGILGSSLQLTERESTLGCPMQICTPLPVSPLTLSMPSATHLAHMVSGSPVSSLRPMVEFHTWKFSEIRLSEFLSLKTTQREKTKTLTSQLPCKTLWHEVERSHVCSRFMF